MNQWVDQLTDLVVAHGFHTFILSADSDDQLTQATLTGLLDRAQRG